MLNGVKERVGEIGTATAYSTFCAAALIVSFIEMQQNFLTIASKRTQNWLENRAHAKDTAINNPVGLAGQAMKEFVAAQRKFL